MFSLKVSRLLLLILEGILVENKVVQIEFFKIKENQPKWLLDEGSDNVEFKGSEMKRCDVIYYIIQFGGNYIFCFCYL